MLSTTSAARFKPLELALCSAYRDAGSNQGSMSLDTVEDYLKAS
jgi:hypothetical protein